MKNGMRFLCAVIVMVFSIVTVSAQSPVDIKAKSAILIAADTGEVLLEQNADERMPIASVTKVMTMLLAMEALQSGKITMDENVTASEHACSMGGSQVYLEPGEQMTVSDMLKAIAVASANDASVAIAEHIMGSDTAFIAAMNERAKALGMNNTNFMNCNGLDEDNHYSSARDVAIMSRELLKHEEIKPFLSIWMDTLRDGEFGLANTNKLIKFYQGAIGIKTGSTGKAKYCLSAAAKRNDLTLVAAVLAAETTADRFATASKLLDYGFANYSIVTGINKGETIQSLPVTKGVQKEVEIVAGSDFKKLMAKGGKAKMEQQVILPESISAPVRANNEVGEIIFTSNGAELGRTKLVAKTEVKRTTVVDTLIMLIKRWTLTK